jgi:hypothetical protein
VSNTTDRPMYYSQVRIDPNNDQVIYMGGAPAFKSIDGGRTFRQIQNLAHSDHHAIWIDPKNSSHVMYGNDGGLDVSYDGGDTWDFIATMAVGQFYAIRPTCGSRTSCAAACRTTGRGAGRAGSARTSAS